MPYYEFANLEQQQTNAAQMCSRLWRRGGSEGDSSGCVGRGRGGGGGVVECVGSGSQRVGILICSAAMFSSAQAAGEK